MNVSNTIEAVYFVSCDDRNLRLDPIAIRPTFDANLVMWENTGYGRTFEIKKSDIESEIKKTKLPEKIEIVTEEGKHITLTKMTVQLFNKHVRDRAAGNPSFHSNDELQKYYLNTNFDYYGP